MEVEFLRKSDVYVCKFRWEFFFLVRINLMSTKRKKANSNLYLRKEPWFNTINEHFQQQNRFYKKWHNRIEIVINGNSKNQFSFCCKEFLRFKVAQLDRVLYKGWLNVCMYFKGKKVTGRKCCKSRQKDSLNKKSPELKVAKTR